MSVLMTGFTPFGVHETNASELLMQELRGASGVDARVIPTSYKRAADAVTEALSQGSYSAIFLFGLAAKIKQPLLEQVALNLTDCAACDIDNQTLSRSPIIPDAPVAYRSTLPLEEMAAIAAKAEEPVGWSRDAGGYVCNHTFFRVMHQAAVPMRVPCGFVHLPILAAGSERLRRIATLARAWAGLFEDQA